jgi:hypothetical protein
VAARRPRARELGADAALDPRAPDLAEQARTLAGDGFDVVLEASGARAALRQAFDLVRPGGTLVQIGTLGTEDVPLPANQLMVREINYVGSMRYGPVFDEASRLRPDPPAPPDQRGVPARRMCRRDGRGGGQGVRPQGAADPLTAGAGIPGRATADAPRRWRRYAAGVLPW